MTLDDPEYLSFIGFRLYMGVRNGGSEPLLLLFIRRKGLKEVPEECQARLEGTHDSQEQLLLMG